MERRCFSAKRPMSHVGQKAKCLKDRMFSGLPRGTDIAGPAQHVANVPKPEVGGPYSITSSARASSVGGIVKPIALAVLRLITISNLSD